MGKRVSSLMVILRIKNAKLKVLEKLIHDAGEKADIYLLSEREIVMAEIKEINTIIEEEGE